MHETTSQYEIPARYEEPGIRYKVPDIIYEGELEVQAGSPVGLPVWDEENEW